MKLNFGKYNGKTLEDLLTIDPSYLVWVAKNIKNNTIRKEAHSVLMNSKLKTFMQLTEDFSDIQRIDENGYVIQDNYNDHSNVRLIHYSENYVNGYNIIYSSYWANGGYNIYDSSDTVVLSVKNNQNKKDIYNWMWENK